MALEKCVTNALPCSLFQHPEKLFFVVQGTQTTRGTSGNPLGSEDQASLGYTLHLKNQKAE